MFIIWISENAYGFVFPFFFHFRSQEPARKEVRELISKMAEREPEIPQWVLTSFKDPDTKLVKKTNNVEDLKSALSELRYGGGGDVPEQAFKGAIYERSVGFPKVLKSGQNRYNQK